MKNMITILTLIFQLSVVIAYSKADSLRNEIEDYTLSMNAEIGVAIYNLESGDTLTIDNNKHYPMQSVFKFHLALTVLHQIDIGKLSLNQKLLIKKEDLRTTWSPLKQKYPDGNIELTLSEILTYTISQSDNNGCDILFKLIGGPKVVDKYIHSLGIKDVSIKATEQAMSKAWNIQFTNWTTPYSAVLLLDKFFNKNILSKSSFDFLMNAMINSSNAINRIKGQLPKEAVVAHKTGSSEIDDKGITAAVNDIGIVTLPYGHHIAIAVFVTNSKENDDTNAKIISDISKMVWNYYIAR